MGRGMKRVPWGTGQSVDTAAVLGTVCLPLLGGESEASCAACNAEPIF